MTAVNRALMLLMPLFAFAVAGAIYTPTASQNTLPGEGEGEVTLSSLPPLPNWANEGLPDFSTYQDTTEKKVAFFSYLYPRIVLANSRILLEREYLTTLEGKDALTKDELAWLTSQGDRLRIEAEAGTDQQFDLLQFGIVQGIGHLIGRNHHRTGLQIPPFVLLFTHSSDPLGVHSRPSLYFLVRSSSVRIPKLSSPSNQDLRVQFVERRRYGLGRRRCRRDDERAKQRF